MLLPSDDDRARGRAPLGLVIFLALMTSVVALTVDAILPALDSIAADLGFSATDEAPFLVMVVFVGMGIGQPVFGPVADAIGRRNTALIGWAIYLIGTVIAVLAPGLWGVLLGRLLQGIGAAGPRIVAMAIVRDLYAGRPMARIMSIVMTVFMLVPMLAPLIGQQAENIGGWQAIYGLYLLLAVVCIALHVTMVPETLATDRRKPLSLGPVIAAYLEVLKTPATMLYTLALSAIFSAFAAMLSSAQHLYETLFDLGEDFPLVFASVAGMIALAQIVNARLVMRLGMRRLTVIAAIMVLLGGGAATAITWQVWGTVPAVWAYVVMMAPVFVGSGLMFSNLTALALEPLGHMSGTGSAAVMSISSLLAVPFGSLIAIGMDTSVLPLMLGFGIAGALVLALVALAEMWR